MVAPGEPESSAFAARFAAALAYLPAPDASGRWLVAFSGGLDSTLLLHQMTRWRNLRAASAPTTLTVPSAQTVPNRPTAPTAPIAAVHVDHGLHPDSPRWSAHCAAECGRLGVDYLGLEVAIAPRPGESLEAEAREARYAALAERVGPGDVLLTAHQADDQLETILLRVLRGSGVRGLTAIHAVGRLGAGRLARPLLEFSRREIEAEAERLGLVWLTDPSNDDPRFDRNFLRLQCLPRLLERWPRAGAVASRLARQMGEAEEVLNEVAEADLSAVPERDRMSVEVLAALSAARQSNALRWAIRSLGLPLPSAAQLAELRALLDVRDDAEAVVHWPGAEARIYRRHLYLQAPLAEPAAAVWGRLAVAAPLALGEGRIELVASGDYGIPDRWARAGLDVRPRAGGERFRPRQSHHHKSLKHWFQDEGLVPWMRPHVPLLFHDDRLVAVADLCLADDLPQSDADAPFWRPVWTRHPRLH